MKGGKYVQDARKSNFTAKCLNTFDAHCSSKFIITSVVLDIRDQSLLMAWWGVEIIFGGNHWNFKGGSVTTESPKEAGSTIPVPVIIMFCRHTETSEEERWNSATCFISFHCLKHLIFRNTSPPPSMHEIASFATCYFKILGGVYPWIPWVPEVFLALFYEDELKTRAAKPREKNLPSRGSLGRLETWNRAWKASGTQGNLWTPYSGLPLRANQASL